MEKRHRRREVIQQVETRLKNVPLRDFALVAGDFNSHAITDRPYIGPSVPHKPRFATADVTTLPKLCRPRGLTALNTWASGHRGTYSKSYESQIDFILVRLQDARRNSKAATSDRNFPVATYREGSRHFPVRSQLFIPPYSPPPDKPKHFDTIALDASFRRKDEEWQK